MQRKKVHKSLKEMAYNQVLSNKNEIFSIEFENKRYWVKKARPTVPNTIQTLFYKFLPFELLIPSQAKSAQEALNHETQKLLLFHKMGIPTPNVIYSCNDFFILEDVGTAIHAIIRQKDISEEQLYYYIDKVIETLALIHNKNQFHGGAQTRNFTYKNGDIFAIDLEESFESNVESKTLQFRDLLLLLLSFVKIKADFELDYKHIIEKYVMLTGNTFVVARLKKLARKISFLLFLGEIQWIKKLLGSDVKGFLQLFKTLQKL
jgi:tRNA A-37 threonylcarbamoyl transferase component Bud32